MNNTGLAVEAAEAAALAASVLRLDVRHNATCFTDLDRNEVVLEAGTEPAGITFNVPLGVGVFVKNSSSGGVNFSIDCLMHSF